MSEGNEGSSGQAPKRWPWWKRGGATVGLIFVLGVVLLVTFQRRLIFPHQGLPQRAEALTHAGGEAWWLDSDQGRVEAWWLPGDGVSAESPGPAVIFAHGNGELIDYWPGELGRYRRMGVGVLLVEYRGYGRSAGSPSQAAIESDFIAFYDRLVARPEVDRSRILFHGRSLGGGAVSALARHRRPAAMILMSTFTSIKDMAWELLRAPGFLVKDPFESLEVVRSLNVPLLVIHGTRDELIPLRMGQSLANEAPQGRLVTYEAGHNNCPPNWAPFWQEARKLMDEAGFGLGER